MKPKDISFNDWEVAYKKNMGEVDSQPPPGYITRKEIMALLKLEYKPELWQRRRLEKMVMEGWLEKVTKSRTHYYKPILPGVVKKHEHKKLSLGKNGDHGAGRKR